jgi:hypothetical protein
MACAPQKCRLKLVVQKILISTVTLFNLRMVERQYKNDT